MNLLVPHGAFNIWRENPPPRDTYVWAKYKLKEQWQLVKTCKRGCCVYIHGDGCYLPKYWQVNTSVVS